MPALDPLLMCISAAVLVLVAHGIFALGRRRAGGGEPGPVLEGIATLLCGLALIGPLAVLPFVTEAGQAVVLVGTTFAVIASSLPIVMLQRREVGAAEQLVVNRRLVTRPAPRSPATRLRVVVPRGTDPEEAVRSAVTGPIPRITTPPERIIRTEGATTVAGPRHWAPPPPPSPAVTQAAAPAPAADAPEAPVPPALREAEHATKALDEVENTVLDVKSWLRLDR